LAAVEKTIYVVRTCTYVRLYVIKQWVLCTGSTRQ